MKILIVAATKFEVQPLIDSMAEVKAVNECLLICKYKKLDITILITGVGMVATAYYTGKVLDDTFDGAFNLGLCGSYNRNLELGAVITVYEDLFSELGAEDGDHLLTLDDLKLKGVSKISNFKLAISNSVIELLPKVNGITVNTTHGNEQTIEKIAQKFHPMVESMEGAAFMFVCENECIPYAQIRAVSNYVERRNKEAWDIPLAIVNLNKKMTEILNSF